MNRICFIMNHFLLSVTFVQNLLDNFFQYRFCTNIMYGKLNIINNTFRREQWNTSSCTIWHRLQYAICPLMPHPWYWSGYHMVHEDVQIEISFRWYRLIGTKKFLNSAELGEKFFVSMCFDYTCRLTWIHLDF